MTMNQIQLFAKSFSRVIYLVTMFLAVPLINANSVFAQSMDIGNPTPLTSNEISGSFDSDNQGENYFYSFTADSGELVVTFSLKAPSNSSTAQYSVALIDENSKVLGNKAVTVGYVSTEQQTLRVNVPKRQVLLLRINTTAVIGGGSASYRIRLSGAVSNNGIDAVKAASAAAQELINQSKNSKANSLECLPKKGTLIIRMKDGSKKIIDLTEAETVTVVP